MNPCKKSKSAFTGYGTLVNGYVNLGLVSNKSGKVLLSSYYTDSSLSVLQGLYQLFFPNGVVEREGYYENDKEDGDWKIYDSTGKLKDSIMYQMGKKLSTAHYVYDNEKHLLAEELNNYVDDSYTKKYYAASGELQSLVMFKGQKGIIQTYFDGQVRTDSVFSREIKEATFPGGNHKWREYVQAAMSAKEHLLLQEDKQENCVITFSIDTTGKLVDIEVLTRKGSMLAKVMVNALLTSPKWEPAIVYGKIISSKIRNSYSVQVIKQTPSDFGEPILSEMTPLIPRLRVVVPRT